MLDFAEVFVVGGAVRDKLLGREPNDYDYVVVGATPQDMFDAGFDEPVGESFAVFLHPETNDEWALARTEESKDDGPADFDIRADGEVSLEEDLRRRDLTINAMAMDPETEEIIDPHGGKEDIEDRVLRHVSEAFKEDPLRVVRIATFRARYPEFSIAPETKDLCKLMDEDRISSIAPQRIYREMLKAFRKAEDPRNFFDTLDELDALELLFPWVADLKEVRAGPKEYHAEGSAYEHTMMVLQEAQKEDPNNIRLLLAALSHDLGKARTKEEDLPSHPDHTKTGLDVVEEMDESLQIMNHHESVMKDAVRNHMKTHDLLELNDTTLIDFVDEQMGDRGLTMDELLLLSKADSRGRVPSTEESDLQEKRERVEAAREVIESIGGKFIMEKFDVDKSEGLKIRDLIKQERTETFREIRAD